MRGGKGGGVISVTKGGDGDGLVHYGGDKVFSWSVRVQGCDVGGRVAARWVLDLGRARVRIREGNVIKYDALDCLYLVLKRWYEIPKEMEGK
ncbi:hypothetical protein Tco_0870320 [Tanacetum coccineum]